MGKHLLTEIKIKDFKCFKNFKADGFKRINLIGGKNNVGKTAFMEACFLANSSFEIFKANDYSPRKGARIDREWFHFEIIKILILIKQNRERVTFLTDWFREELDLTTFSNFEIEINNKFRLTLNDNFLMPEHFNVQAWSNWGSVDISKYMDSKYYSKVYKKNSLPIIDNYSFISICDDENKIKTLIDDLKLNKKYKKMNKLLKEIFGIEQIDIIKNKVMLKQNDKFEFLNDYGDGIKHFINMIVILLSSENTAVYLDEVDNGIYYRNFDKLWEIILTISKEQNVQVFATTHSKECIESYARVSRKLKDKEMCYIKMTELKDGSIKAGVRNYAMFQDSIDDEHEVRGW